MLKIGITGGIGCGKTTIANLFNSSYNIPVIDADIIAHQLVEPGKPALQSLEHQFGKLIITEEGALNRQKLRELIFSDPALKDQLEQILHPLIYQQMQCEFEQQSTPYSLLCIPLLMETKMTAFVDKTLVIDCSVNQQIERVQSRDKLSRDQILSIINSQVSREYRLSHADNVINNSNSTTQLADHIKKLHNQYLLLSNC